MNEIRQKVGLKMIQFLNLPSVVLPYALAADLLLLLLLDAPQVHKVSFLGLFLLTLTLCVAACYALFSVCIVDFAAFKLLFWGCRSWVYLPLGTFDFFIVCSIVCPILLLLKLMFVDFLLRSTARLRLLVLVGFFWDMKEEWWLLCLLIRSFDLLLPVLTYGMAGLLDSTDLNMWELFVWLVENNLDWAWVFCKAGWGGCDS